MATNISNKLNLAWQRKQRIQKYRLLCDTYNSNEMQTESAVQCTQTHILHYTVRFREWLLCLTIVTEFEFKSMSPSISVNIEMALNYDLFVTNYPPLKMTFPIWNFYTLKKNPLLK